jgi:hypothetical protein
MCIILCEVANDLIKYKQTGKASAESMFLRSTEGKTKK